MYVEASAGAVIHHIVRIYKCLPSLDDIVS